MSEPVKVFLSYDEKDENLLDELLSHLKSHEHKGLIDLWDKRKVLPGKIRNDEIKVNLEQAKIILFLVSADFISSDDCYKIEVPRALALHNANASLVIPILVRSCMWKETVFKNLEALPKDGQFVRNARPTPQDRDQYWALIAEEIFKIADFENPQIWKVPVDIRDEERSPEEPNYFTEDLGKDVTLHMVAIPGDIFQMGSKEQPREQPVHPVTISSFYMGRYPVTQAQYEVIMGNNPSHFKGANLPVENISWNNAVEFCERLTARVGYSYYLPSESQWEYACRAGTETLFSFGTTLTTKLANYNGVTTSPQKAQGIFRNRTTLVGSFPQNAFGLYDMHGNVWEWCQDNWHENYEGAPSDGTAWLSKHNSNHLLRGGSWKTDDWRCRSTCCFHITANNRDNDYGFRIACSAPKAKAI
jgi:formylglycine-generating enzyme required for sulfatase activity